MEAWQRMSDLLIYTIIQYQCNRQTEEINVISSARFVCPWRLKKITCQTVPVVHEAVNAETISIS